MLLSNTGIESLGDDPSRLNANSDPVNAQELGLTDLMGISGTCIVWHKYFRIAERQLLSGKLKSVEGQALKALQFASSGLYSMRLVNEEAVKNAEITVGACRVHPHG